MYKFKLDNKIYNLPQSYYEMTTSQYIKLTEMLKLYIDDDGQLQNLDENTTVRLILKMLFNLNEIQVNQIYVHDMLQIINSLKFLQQQPKHLNTKVLKIKGLIIKIKDFEKLNFGDYADIMQLMSSEKDIIKAYSKQIECYRPKNWFKFRFRNKKLDLDNEKKINIINNLSVNQFFTLVFFLNNSMIKYSKNIVYYLNLKATKMHINNASQATGVIIRGLWTYVTKIFRN